MHPEQPAYPLDSSSGLDDNNTQKSPAARWSSRRNLAAGPTVAASRSATASAADSSGARSVPATIDSARVARPLDLRIWSATARRAHDVTVPAAGAGHPTAG